MPNWDEIESLEDLECFQDAYEEFVRDMEQYKLDCAIELLKEAGYVRC